MYSSDSTKYYIADHWQIASEIAVLTVLGIIVWLTGRYPVDSALSIIAPLTGRYPIDSAISIIAPLTGRLI